MDVAVLGATADGLAVAGYCATAGHAVALYAEDANGVVDAIDDLEVEFGPDAADRVDGTTDLEAAVDGAAAVVEATDGDEAARRERLAAAESAAVDDALIATAGESSATAVAAGLRRPARAVGLHLVRTGEPAVVEVVVADQTARETLDRARSFVEDLGATALVVADAPGFASARLDLALVLEAIRLVSDGVASVADADRAVELGRDHPLGPLALADEIGLDRVLEASEDLHAGLGDRFAPPALLREKVADGALGKRTGEGFYVWEDGERVRPAEPDPEVATRTDPPTDPEER